MPEIKNTNVLSPDNNLRESLILMLKSGIEEMYELANDKRGIEDPEVVHDLRVSARRLQTVLEAIGDILPATILRKAKIKVKDIIKTLGKARENDVSIELIERFLKKNKKDDGRNTILLLVARFKKEALDERVKALSNSNVFDDINYFKSEFLNKVMALKIKSFRAIPSLRISKDLKSNGLFILPGLFDRVIKLAKISDKQPDDSNSELLHQMRIKAKPVRYTMEFFRFVYGDDFAELTKEMKKFVEILGDIHDRDVLIEQLSNFREEIKIYNALNKKNKLKTGLIEKLIKTLQNERKEMFSRVEKIISSWMDRNFREKLILSMN